MTATTRAILLFVALSAACARPVTEDTTPDWLTALIAQLESEPVANPPAVLAQYEYKGQTVYYLPPRCCDVPSVVYGQAGNVICSADGGLTGKGNGRCPDFFAERKDEKIIWRDKRGPN